MFLDRNKKYKFLWSILICTLDERKEDFNYIVNKLNYQINKNKLNEDIEILYFSDNRENSIGFKRNSLLSDSKGKYVCFVDDDDDLSDNYIKVIYKSLLENKDCSSLNGIITFDGKNPKKFIHSIEYDNYFEKNDIYYRPPNHLNPIKRDLVSKIKFPDINFGEDADWTMQVAKSKILKTEAIINDVYYFYSFKTKNKK